MTAAALRADCARCAALCCVALAFDRSSLDGCGRCRIHAAKAQAGFAGCAGYDCAGAGQRVTQEVFNGRSWREHPELLAPMLRAFAVLRRVHELRLLLREAAKLPLTSAERETLRAFDDRLEPAGGWSEVSLAEAPIEEIAAHVRAFLMSLRRYVEGRRRTAQSSFETGSP
jgi:hypothetical protein